MPNIKETIVKAVSKSIASLQEGEDGKCIVCNHQTNTMFGNYCADHAELGVVRVAVTSTTTTTTEYLVPRDMYLNEQNSDIDNANESDVLDFIQEYGSHPMLTKKEGKSHTKLSAKVLD